MKFIARMAAAALAALVARPALADTTVFSEGFEQVSSLEAKGWSFWNVGEDPVGNGWLQGDIFMAAEDGPYNSFVYSGYQATKNDSIEGEYISAFLVTPEIQLTGQSTLHFWIEGPGPEYFKDSLRVLVAPGSATQPADFTQTLFNVNGPPPFWLALDLQLPTNLTSVRIAFEYYGPNGTANYLALDSLSITTVPEPDGAWMLAAGLAALALLKRRR